MRCETMLRDRFRYVQLAAVLHIGLLLLLPTSVQSGSRGAIISEEEFVAEEEQPIGTEIARLHGHHEAPPPYAALQWKPRAGSAIFEVSREGVFKLKARLDREAAFPSTSGHRYELLLQSLTTRKVVKVVFLVADVNDNVPRFQPTDNVTLRVAETTPTTTRLRVGVVIDRDSGDNGLVTSRLDVRGDLGDDESFELVTSNRAGETILELVVKKPLDYESRKEYSFTIVCKDSGHKKQLQAQMSVQVIVQDVNDNAPYFVEDTDGGGDEGGGSYARTVHENATRGHEVITMVTGDLDSGDNGVVTYRLSPTLDTNGNADTTFAIDRKSGRLYVNGPLDADHKGLYELLVIAEDGGDHVLSASAIVRITVLDINDNAPNIAMIYLTDSGGPRLTLEKVNVGDFVARFSITDEDDSQQDTSEDNEITVELLDDLDQTFHLQERLRNVYFLAVSRRLTLAHSYSLRLRAVDRGGLTAEVRFRVDVVSEGGVSPDDGTTGAERDPEFEFEQREYAASVRDTDRPRDPTEPLLRVGLRTSVQGTVYSIAETEATPSGFSVNADTGDVYLVTDGAVRCGSRTSRTVVSAHLPRHSTEATPISRVNCTVVFEVRAVRDNPPRFRETTLHTLNNVSEDTIPGTCYDLMNKPDDPDCGETLVYFETSKKRNPYFSVDKSTGTICLTKKLDYEDKPIVIINITVIDKYDLKDTLMILVEVVPVLRKRLTFTTPLRYHVQRSLKVGTLLAVVEARGQTGFEVVYNLVDATADILNQIRLDQTSGIITLTREFPSDVEQLDFLVEARYPAENRQRSLNATVPLTFKIRADDSSLLVTNPLQVFEIRENLLNDKLGNVHYSNDDEIVTWVIEAINRHLLMDTSTGSFGVHRSFDYETNKQEVMSVYLRTSTAFLSCQILVKVTNTLDSTPLPTLKDTVIYVDQKISSRTALMTFTSSPLTSTYTLENHLYRFYIRNDRLYTLGLERDAVYEVKIRVTAELETTQNIKIVVRNNQSVCEFSNNFYIFHIDEGVAGGSPLGRVDVSCDATVSFRLDNGYDSDEIEIDASTGLLRLKSTTSVDYELRPSYRLRVLAYGVLADQKPTAAMVYVVVRNLADTVPVFERDVYRFKVRERLPAGTIVGRINVDDKENNVEYSYTMNSGEDSRFKVNIYNGDVITNEIFDYETIAEYEFTVHYSRTSLSGEVVKTRAEVVVTVLNVNDNAPLFTGPAVLALDSREGVTIEAIDADHDIIEYSIVTEGDYIGDAAFLQLTSGRLSLRPDAVKKQMYTVSVRATDGLHAVVRTLRLTRANGRANGARGVGIKVTRSAEFTVDTDAALYSVVGSVQLPSLTHQQSSIPMIYTLEGGDARGYFSVGSTDGVLVVASRIDVGRLEPLNYGPLIIKAVDADIWRPSRSTLIAVAITFDRRQSSPASPTTLPSLHVELTIVDYSRADISIYEDAEAVKMTIVSGREAFSVDHSGLRVVLRPAEVDEDIEGEEVMVTAVDSEGGATVRLIVVRVRLRRDHRYRRTPPRELRLREDWLPGTPVWQDSDVTSISSGNHFGWFEVEPSTGILRIARRLDAELERDVILTFRHDNANLYTLNIHVQNSNDNTPTVRPNSDSIARDGTVTISAEDLDKGDILSYALIEPTYNCTMDTSTGVITLPPVVNAGQEILLRGYVTDNGRQSRFTRFQRLVTFPPVSSRPRFVSSAVLMSRLSLMEGRRYDDIGFVVATSSDPAAQVQYSITGGNSDNLFAVHPTSGVISCNYLDFEAVTTYNLTLRATLRGSSSDADHRVALTEVRVAVIDVNDNAPFIAPPPPGEMIVKWTAVYNKTVMTLSATDVDRGADGVVRFSLHNNSEALFGLDAITGRLYVNGILPRIESRYYLEVIATDSGKTLRLASSVTVVISVVEAAGDPATLDTTANPSFSQSEYFIGVREGSESGTVLQKFDVNTVDLSKLEYSIVVGNSNVFSLVDGSLRTTVVVDAEIGAHYDLVVEVRVQGSRGFARVTVIVDVLDANDNAPYVSEHYNLHVNEDTLPGEVIGRIVASDVDQGQTLTFNFRDRPTDYPIRIQRITGEIVLLRAIRYDDTKTLDFSVTVSDYVTYSTTSVTFIVMQSQANRHAPKFNKDFYYVNVSEHQASGSNLLTVVAVDLDKDDVTYELENDYTLFQINEYGILSTTATLPSSSTYQYYPVTVIAKDEHQAATKVTVLIQVIQNNDWKPEFTKNLYRIQITDDLARGAVVETFRLVKRSPQVSIRLTGARQSQFSVGPGGRLVVTTDRLHYGQYALTVRATHAGNRRYTEAKLMIGVGHSASESGPKFTRGARVNVTAPVAEAGRVLYRPLVTGSGSVRFSIAAGDLSTFEAHPTTGKVTARVDISRGAYLVTVKITDAEGVWPAYQDVVIRVENGGRSRYGAAPRFRSVERVASLMERTAHRAYVCTVRALSDSSEAIRYSVSGAEFAVDQRTGVLTSAVRFDRSRTSESAANVTAEVGGRRGHVLVRVVVLADDDLTPAFLIPAGVDEYRWPAVTEPGATLGRVNAVAPTDSREGGLRYRLYEGDSEARYYEVNGTTGVVTRVAAAESRRRRSTDDRSLHVVAELGTRRTGVTIRLTPAAPITKQPGGGGDGGGLSGTPIVLIVVCLAVALVAGGVVLAVWLLRRRDRQRKPRHGLDNGACDVVESSIMQATLDLPPYRQTLPDLPPESSGRGSAIDYDGDEEIRMINATPLNLTSSDTDTRAHDSGIARDSEADSQLHHDYLTSMGVPVLVDTPPPQQPPPPKTMAPRIELHEMLRLDNPLPSMPSSPLDHKYATIDEIAAGSYNWDHLLGWTPAYQPLADVFAEIARLKDDNRRLSGFKRPTRIVEHGSNATSLTRRPPPIITDAPPDSVAADRGRHLSPAGYDHDAQFSASVITPSLTPQLTPPDYLESVQISNAV